MTAWRRLVWGWLPVMLATGMTVTTAAGPVWPDPAFQWGERKFSRAEAEKIVALAPEIPKTQTEACDWIRRQEPLLAGIVLCERSGIRLSAEDTLAALKLEILMLPRADQVRFLEACRKLGVDSETLLRRDASRIDRQFQNAIRQWYRRTFADEATLSDDQVSDWYFRHQERFLTVEFDPDTVFVLADDPDLPEQAAAWLRQGMPPATVRRKLAIAVSDTKLRACLEQRGRTDIPEAGFTLYRGDGFQIMTRSGAVRKVYCKLTPELTEAIRNALYDALAKARLAERLAAEMSRNELVFF